jgi:hypothetical protein
MGDGLAILIFLLFLFAFIGCALIGFFVTVRWMYRAVTGTQNIDPPLSVTQENCDFCGRQFDEGDARCTSCNKPRPVPTVADELVKDLAATTRQLKRLRSEGKISAEALSELMLVLNQERSRITGHPEPQPQQAQPQIAQDQPRVEEPTGSRIDDSTAAPIPQTGPAPVEGGARPPISFFDYGDAPVDAQPDTDTYPGTRPSFADETRRGDEQSGSEHGPRPGPSRQEVPPTPPPVPARPFSEVLTAFMEQSNIRWGEIIGGLLIIGCSTALVVSLWNEISQIPVLKFLIFTTVTAALFGVGLYTEHRWKLPTTSRGILTIATLLVPLNFLAIAAVSGGGLSGGPVILASELVAPAIFLCLVYFAGRVITPDWPQLLTAAVLGSSVGQLLVRHIIGPTSSPLLLGIVGLLPVAFYIGAGYWMLARSSEKEIREAESNELYITLGAATFSTILPLSLLLHRTGHAAESLGYVAPLLALGSMTPLMVGLFLWRRLATTRLIASQTAGIAVAILGAFIGLSAVHLSWSHPGNVAVSALIEFALFTFIAFRFEARLAHLVGALMLVIGLVAGFQIAAGHAGWRSIPDQSLADLFVSASTGQFLSLVFVLLLVAAEWLERQWKDVIGRNCYLSVAGLTGAFGVLTISKFGFGVAGDPYWASIIYAIYCAGTFFVAARLRNSAVAFIASGLLLVTTAQILGTWVGVQFPWQAASLTHALLCALAVLFVYEKRGALDALGVALNHSALITSSAAVLMMMQAASWEPTALLASRIYWLAVVWLVLLWVNRSRALFNLFQAALTVAVVVTVKAVLSNFDWYAYSRNATLNPWSLQTHGTALGLLGLGWVVLRFIVARLRVRETAAGDRADLYDTRSRLVEFAGTFLKNGELTFDRLVSGAVLAGFFALCLYAVYPGVELELSQSGATPVIRDIAGFPHSNAVGFGGWVLFGTLVLLMLASLWRERITAYAVGVLVALYCAVPLFAARFESEFAAASAVRWFAAFFLGFCALLYWQRSRIAAFAGGMSDTEANVSQTLNRRSVLGVLITLSLWPVAFFTAAATGGAINYVPVHGPSAGLFHWIGPVVSYTLPLVIVSLAFVLFALGIREAGFAFAAAVLINLAVTVAHVLTVMTRGGSMNRVVMAQGIQYNAIAAAMCAILWLTARHRWAGMARRREETLIKVLLGAAISLNATLILPVVFQLIVLPNWVGIGTSAAGSVPGWLALVLTVIGTALLAKEFNHKIRAEAVFIVALAVVALLAFDASAFHRGSWFGFHVLLAGVVATGWLMLALRIWADGDHSEENHGILSQLSARLAPYWNPNSEFLSAVAGILAVSIGVWSAGDDPTRPLWPVASILAVVLLFAALNWVTYRRSALYVAGLLTNLGVTIWWGTGRDWSRPDVSIIQFVEVNLLALSLPGIIWMLLEFRRRRQFDSPAGSLAAVPFHQIAAVLSVLMSVLMVLLLIVLAIDRNLVETNFGLGLVSILAAGLFLTATLWDDSAQYSTAELYIIGLTLIGLVINRIEQEPNGLAWALTVGAGLYAVATSVAWWRRDWVASIVSKWGIEARPDKQGVTWLHYFNLCVAVLVVLSAFDIVLDKPSYWMRLSAGLVVGLQCLTFGLTAQGESRVTLQRLSLVFLCLGAVLSGWAWLIPGVSGTWLNRAVIVMIVMLGLIAIDGLASRRIFRGDESWMGTAREIVPYLGGAGGFALFFVLATEVSYQVNYGAVRINLISLITVAVTLLSAAVIAIVFAVSPRHDPLGLSEKGRMSYVYVAEGMLALLFMHIRLTMPWLFGGFFQQYWPLVIISIAFAGVGLSEFLRRHGLHVLSTPIERTGAFLPVLPVLGFWAINSRVEYSTVLFAIGLLYMGLSILRGSFAFGLLAALAGNGGLWHVLQHTENLGFFQHPQLWLIPFALSALIAAHINRERFSEDQMAGIRYLALMVVYVSSTADIFINGVAESPWLPLVLGALSIVGVLTGISLRIRAFLYLGSTFLLIAIITMIWYASANLGWTWLWYVAGIATGAMIIFTFAMFEKKRAEMIRMVDGLRAWER